MHIGLISRPQDPVSLRVYAANLVREVAALGVEVMPFLESGPIPAGCDLVWDPALCMRRLAPVLRGSPVPVVGTMHGIKAFALPLEDLADTEAERWELAALKDALITDWSWFSDEAAVIVAVSRYAADEVGRAFGLPAAKVRVVYNGVNHHVFSPGSGVQAEPAPYFLCVASPNPIKNLRRIFAAYARLPLASRPEMVVVAPGYGGMAMGEGVRLISEEITQEELVGLYRGALALMYTSLRETFGMPILEAMACGCPVITSDATGCAEVAADAALRVNPHSVDAMAAALQEVAESSALRESLRAKGLARAQLFSWRRSAEQLVEVFQAVVPTARKRAMRLRKLEVTTTAGCKVACKFCPQRAFTLGYIQTGATTMLSWETFTTSIDKLPSMVGVSFGGMSEPFQNQRCTDMILYAKREGHPVEIFTTLVGLEMDGLTRLVAGLSLGNDPLGDRMFVHVASAENLELIPVDATHRAMLRYLLDSGLAIEFHYHGSLIHGELRELPFGDRLKFWPIHDRADNETVFYRKGKRKTGRLACIMNLEVNFLLPNGDVAICCQDYGAKHVIGNLLRDSPEALYRSDGFRAVQEALADDALEIMCRYCQFAVKEDGARGGSAT